MKIRNELNIPDSPGNSERLTLNNTASSIIDLLVPDTQWKIKHLITRIPRQETALIFARRREKVLDH